MGQRCSDELAAGENRSMRKNINLKDVAILMAVAFAWTKIPSTRIVPAREVLPSAPEDWKATSKDGAYNKQNPLPGYTFGGDFGPWFLWEPVR